MPVIVVRHMQEVQHQNVQGSPEIWDVEQATMIIVSEGKPPIIILRPRQNKYEPKVDAVSITA